MAAAAARRVLTFAVGDQSMAIDAALVAEVARNPTLTRVPQAPTGLKGLANIRGQVVPVVALDRLLGGARTGDASRVILLDRTPPIGLAVDSVRAMRDAEGGQGGFVETEDGPSRLLDLERLIADAFAASSRPAPAARRRTPAAARETQTAPDVALLAFELAGQAYALPLSDVREVLAAPDALRALPHTDAAMLGVLPVRGRLLPAVSVAAVLGLKAGREAGDARVVVTAIGQGEVALVVDAVSGILRLAPDRIDAAPALLNRGAGEARIEQIARTPGGLVSILAPDRVLDEASVASFLADATAPSQAPERADKERAMRQVVIFRLGEEAYGLPIEAVEAVIAMPEAITRAPNAPAFVAGIVSHRGRPVPLIDQARRFAAAGGASASRRVIVTRLNGLEAGLIVDAVEDILRVTDDDISATPDLAAGEAAVFEGVVSDENGRQLVLLVDPARLLSQAEQDIVRALADRLAAT